ncbi:hypothetical protein X276_17805 [Clostridium beijerinckii NRRL B-598]|nr:hypothetical protein X276_17805 [Clostridium beijerinckii NRRL B-598]
MLIFIKIYNFTNQWYNIHNILHNQSKIYIVNQRLLTIQGGFLMRQAKMEVIIFTVGAKWNIY